MLRQGRVPRKVVQRWDVISQADPRRKALLAAGTAVQRSGGWMPTRCHRGRSLGLWWQLRLQKLRVMSQRLHVSGLCSHLWE